MKEYKTTQAQRNAVKNWKHKNKSKQTIYNYKSHSKAFITKYATIDDLNELQQLINERMQQLNDQQQ